MKALKYVGIALGVILLIPVGLVAALALKSPNSRPPPDEKVEVTPERLQRGKYLAEFAGCLDCHSDRDWSQYSGPLKADGLGAGGFCWTEADGLPGSVCASNITPDPKTGLGSWTDGELMRAIREGVRKDGQAIFSLMPFPHFRDMSDEDTRSLVAYLRTLTPIERAVPARKIIFPVSLLMKMAPQPLAGPVEAPARTDTVAYGRYLATIGCRGCHTPMEKGEEIPGMEFAGGNEFKGPWGGRVRTANLTPHATGIGAMTREQFIGRFRNLPEMDSGVKGKNTVMPWKLYSVIPDEDLGAIYDFLRTLKPIEHVVNRYPE